jgi:threonine/homoserine/homoserine lactone efflux protein
MNSHYFAQGLMIGISIAAPVGPIAVLCIERTLNKGRWVGLISGLGAACADALYGCVAGYGLVFIADFLIDHTLWMRLIGGFFLCWLGIRTLTEKPPQTAAETKLKKQSFGLFHAWTSTFFLTLTNPMTLLSFAAIFAALGIAQKNTHYGSASLLVFGVFLGSAFWWLLLSSVVSIFRKKLTPNARRWINRFSGVTLLSFGLLALFASGGLTTR